MAAAKRTTGVEEWWQTLSERDECEHSHNSAHCSITPPCQNRGPVKYERKTLWIRPCVGASDDDNLITAIGDRVEIPWDFARHYCDQSYRPTIEAIAIQGRRMLGGADPRVERVRRTDPGGAGPLCGHRARHPGFRFENGEQTPRFRTMEAIAGALGQRVQELLFAPGLFE